MAIVSLLRIENAESAEFRRARLLQASIQRQPHAGSIASTLPDDDDGREEAVAIATAMVTPALDKLDCLVRYKTTSDRQLFKWVGVLNTLKQQSLAAVPNSSMGAQTPLALVHDAGRPRTRKASK